MLRWNWNEKVGFAIDKQGLKHDIYTGNAFLIFIYEYQESDKDLYQLTNFYVDESHCKNCFGLTKGYEGITFPFDELTLDINVKNNQKFVSILAKAKTCVKENLVNVL